MGRPDRSLPGGDGATGVCEHPRPSRCRRRNPCGVCVAYTPAALRKGEEMETEAGKSTRNEASAFQREAACRFLGQGPGFRPAWSPRPRRCCLCRHWVHPVGSGVGTGRGFVGRHVPCGALTDLFRLVQDGRGVLVSGCRGAWASFRLGQGLGGPAPAAAPPPPLSRSPLGWPWCRPVSVPLVERARASCRDPLILRNCGWESGHHASLVWDQMTWQDGALPAPSISLTGEDGHGVWTLGPSPVCPVPAWTAGHAQAC